MKIEHKVVVLSLIVGFLLWVVEAVVDQLFFYQGQNFWDLLVLDVPGHEKINRAIILISVMGFGFFSSRIIARRRQAEGALQQALTAIRNEHARSEAIIAGIGAGIIIQDLDYKILYENTVQQESVGKHVGEYCYRAYEGLDGLCDGCPMQPAIQDGGIHTQEKEVAVNGENRYFALTASPLKDADGRIIGGIKVVNDLTKRRQAEEENRRLVVELREALAKLKVLSGFLPICASCKKIRDDKGYWNQIEEYIRDHSEAEFSHGICPECARQHYPHYYRKNE